MSNKLPVSSVLLFSLTAGCGGQPTPASCSSAAAATYDPAIDPGAFSATIDNPLLSYTPGTTLKFRDSDGNLIEQDVLGDVKVLMGVSCRRVHDFTKSATGQLIEDTYDYFAQDRQGNVWYFGEDTKAFVDNKVSTEGSWHAGEDCGEPGIVMRGNPQPGDSYRQEYLAGQAEDEADVVSVNEDVTVPYGTFHHCVKTREHTALAPGDLENKYYCAGAGEVLTIDIGTIDAGKREELLTIDGKTAP